MNVRFEAEAAAYCPVRWLRAGWPLL